MIRSACAEAQLWRTTEDLSDVTGPIWWINRVLVPKELRGKGIGRELLCRLKGAVTAQGGSGMIVTPGGYDIPQEDQIAFYRACGFEVVREEGVGVLMLWKGRTDA
jgi:GNAT superfamily N-acetyltransferase